jgi:hypothetical protein
MFIANLAASKHFKPNHFLFLLCFYISGKEEDQYQGFDKFFFPFIFTSALVAL